MRTELRGEKVSQITKNAVKLSAVFHEHGNPFESPDEDKIYNLLTKAGMTKTSANDSMRRDEIGLRLRFIYLIKYKIKTFTYFD